MKRSGLAKQVYYVHNRDQKRPRWDPASAGEEEILRPVQKEKGRSEKERIIKDRGCRLIPIFSPDNKRMRQSAELLAFSGLWFSAGLSHSLFVSNFRA